jgi:predicted permease
MTEATSTETKMRDVLAIILVVGALLTIIYLGGMIIVSTSGNKEEAAKYVLNAVLPLIGTWVGAVIAFYFAKENFEAAARHTRELVQPAAAPARAVTTFMTAYDAMPKIEVPEGTDPDALPLAKLFPGGLAPAALLAADAGGKRIAVVRAKSRQAVYVVHLQTLVLFQAMLPAGSSGTTLADLRKTNATLFARLQSWVTVGKGDTLADAKFAMEGKADCRDVFVTETGRSDSAVVGWLTNAQINQAATA